MRHPEINKRVLVIEEGQFSWKALDSLRSRKKWVADKARTTEGSCEHMLFLTPSNPFNHMVFRQLTRPERFRVFVTTKLPVPIFLQLFLHTQHRFLNHRVRQCILCVVCLFTCQPGNDVPAANEWLSVLRSHWRSPPLSTYPRSQQGALIFDTLTRISSKIPTYPSFSSTEVFTGHMKPTMEHIIMDLFSLPSQTVDAYDISADQTVSGMTKASFIASMITSSPTEWTPSSHMLAIHSLRCHPSGTLLL